MTVPGKPRSHVRQETKGEPDRCGDDEGIRHQAGMLACQRGPGAAAEYPGQWSAALTAVSRHRTEGYDDEAVQPDAGRDQDTKSPMMQCEPGCEQGRGYGHQGELCDREPNAVKLIVLHAQAAHGGPARKAAVTGGTGSGRNPSAFSDSTRADSCQG